ncbi:MAG: S8 family serine peptidase [Gammaproteobacteria bacterium]
MRRSALAICLLLTGIRVAVAVGSVSSGSTPQGVTALQIPNGISAYKGHSRTDGALAELRDEYRGWQARAANDLGAGVPFQSKNTFVPIANGYVTIDAVASGDPQQLRADLERLGFRNAAVHGRMVSGQLPMGVIKGLETLDSLQMVRPAYFVRHAGLVTSEGDEVIRSGEARRLIGVNGSGVTVGTLSDSFNCLGGADSGVAGGDLPGGIVVLEEGPCDSSIDEGRALMEIVHDVAPGTRQMFHTAFLGQANFAQGILDLRNAGARVIVDDVIYLAEPMFQDGAIAQAVDRVVAQGAVFFSAAGNQARVSYEGPFRPSGVFIDEDGFICEAHDFDPDPGLVDIAQRIDVSQIFSATFSFQWDQPFFSVSGSPGAASDIDILLFNTDGSFIDGGFDINTGGDPVEVFLADLPTQLEVDLVITRCDGPGPQLMKYVQFGGPAVINEFATASGTIYGHANARGAEAVGAADYRMTPAFGLTPPVVEDFSSAGGVAIRLNTAGQPLAAPEVRTKPGIVAPDGVNTTSFFFDRDDDNDTSPNFFGTSAAAPHAAAVAALILERTGSLTPDAVYARLRSNAIDMDDPATPAFDTGFDFRTGFGLVDAVRAFPLTERRACQDRAATIVGSDGADTLVGTEGPDVILGLGGNDTVSGLGGDDVMCGGAGNDVLLGGEGRDRLLGETGIDRLFGDRGNDVLVGGPGRDRLNGGPGEDVLNGGPGRDSCVRGERQRGCEGERRPPRPSDPTPPTRPVFPPPVPCTHPSNCGGGISNPTE